MFFDARVMYGLGAWKDVATMGALCVASCSDHQVRPLTSDFRIAVNVFKIESTRPFARLFYAA